MGFIHNEFQTSYGSNHTMYHLNMSKLGQIKHKIKWKWKGTKNEKWTKENMFQNVIQTSKWNHTASINIWGPFLSQKLA